MFFTFEIGFITGAISLATPIEKVKEWNVVKLVKFLLGIVIVHVLFNIVYCSICTLELHKLIYIIFFFYL